MKKSTLSNSKSLTACLKALTKAKSAVEDVLREEHLISNLPDSWFYENLIKTVNPAKLVSELKAEKPHLEKRDRILKEVLRVWLLSGSSMTSFDFREAVITTVSSQSPVPSKSASSDATVRLYGLSEDQLKTVTPEVARMAYLAGRTSRASIAIRKTLSKRLQKRRADVDRALVIMQALHSFKAKLGFELKNLVAREALISAITGEDAIDEGVLADKAEREATKSLHPRPSRQPLFDAWQDCTDQIVILYAISSMKADDGTCLLDRVFDEKEGAEVLYSKLDEIISRARFINDSVISSLREAEDWVTSLPSTGQLANPSLRKRTNFHTVELMSCLEAVPIAFDPSPVAEDILTMLCNHLVK